ncbi:MAG: PH domain-containing protein [Acidobacteriota bacterium]
MNTEPTSPSVDVRAIERPDSSLLIYYGLFSLLFGPFFPIAFAFFFFRYRTMQYRFDDEGVSMSWGALFRREISLAYSRIQDIHLVSNLVERHLGLARLKVQTAAGSSTAEMTIEGLHDFEAVRDFLYDRMRRRRGSKPSVTEDEAGPIAVADGTDLAEVVAMLREATQELRLLRQAVDPTTAERRDGEAS